MLVERWLRFVIRFRWGVLAVTAALLVAAGVLAGGLHKDTSANAYMEPGNPALLYRERVVETFGLKEPIVIAVRSSAAGGILTAEGLRYVRLIAERLEAVRNIDIDRITSLVSRSAIGGGEEGLEVAPLLPAGEIDATAVRRVRDAIDTSPIYDGTLVSTDRSATIPLGDAAFAVTTPLLVPQAAGPVRVEPVRRPSGLRDSSDAGARLAMFIGGWDVTLNYLYHTYDDPVPFIALLSVQYFQSTVRDPVERMTRLRRERQGTFLVQRSWRNESIRLRALWLRSLDRGDGAVQARLSWQASANLSIGMSAERFHGERTGLFGEFRDASRAAVDVQWSWQQGQ